MWRKTAGVVLALSIGFFLYRAALVAMPIAQYGGSPSMTCPEGNVPRPLFDLLTGLPSGVVVSCASRDGQSAVLFGPNEHAYLGPHWSRSLLFGLGGAALALIVLWWSARRRPSPLRRGSEVPTSA